MSININELVTTTLRDRNPFIADNVTNTNAFLYKLDQNGRMKTAEGRVITEPLIYAENGTFKWYNGLETWNITVEEVVDAAEYNWKMGGGFVYLTGEEKIKNRGAAQAIDLVEARVKAAEATMKNQVGTSIYSDGTGSSSKEVGGLQLLIDDDPTSAGTIGGIDQVANTFWRNQFSAAAATTSANIRGRMNSMWLATLRGSDKVDLIMADNDMYTYYEESLQENIRYTTSKMADAGFESIKYKTADVCYDDQCPDKHMYFLNTDHLCMRYAPGRKFKVGKEREIQNADYSVWPFLFAGNLTCSNRSLQGVIIAS